ncbi:MAG: DUF3343 domain-containing protein [Actinobacteria bacterium]|nr:DUF3343 domain-containing protein [Actinomycetota bacterium]
MNTHDNARAGDNPRGTDAQTIADATSPQIVFTFPSTHAAMAAEDALREAGFALEIIPPPPPLSAGCGLAIRLAAALEQAAVATLAAQGLAWHGPFPLPPA